MDDVEYRVLLALGDDLPADRLCALLQGVDRLGSIRQAAAALQFSYRYAWGLLKRAESRLGTPLLTRQVGGAAGGGAVLTEAGRELLNRYHAFRLQVEAGASRTFGRSEQAEGAGAQPLLLASTIDPVETGLLPALEEAFYAETGILVRHIAAGSGQALAIAREGRADLVLVHAPELEQQFLAEGWGDARHPLMYNDFLLLGPAADPAGVRHAGSAVAALRRIAEARALFATRGDRSGTHVQEVSLWEAAGVQPTPPWYQICPQGYMGSRTCLRWAAQRGAYLLVDRATWLTAQNEAAGLAVLLEGDPALRNEFVLMAVSPAKNPGVQFEAAQRFIRWATGLGGQKVITNFGVNTFNTALFQAVGIC